MATAALTALTAVAAFVADSASVEWQLVARAETRWSAAAVESVRTACLDGAPRALTLTQAEIHNEVYGQDLGTGPDRLRDESEVEQSLDEGDARQRTSWRLAGLCVPVSRRSSSYAAGDPDVPPPTGIPT